MCCKMVRCDTMNRSRRKWDFLINTVILMEATSDVLLNSNISSFYVYIYSIKIHASIMFPPEAERFSDPGRTLFLVILVHFAERYIRQYE